jgi:pimeloyl-ACP methyl ester carboxylesterase
LHDAGFDVLLCDYRGYGHSSGRPDEQGTHLDARAALATLLSQPRVDPARTFYLGESLGGAVALKLAIESPPRGLILQSTSTSVRAVARHHYPFIPGSAIPDAYPTIRLIAKLRAPLLVLHGDHDEIVPVTHGQALFAAAAVPKRTRVFADVGHNDLAVHAGTEYAEQVASWARELVE